MSPSAKAGAGGQNLIEKLLSVFASMGDPDAEKKKILKAIGKDLSRSRFKFIKTKGNEALPGLARFFHELYKVTAPAQVFLQNASSSASLRSFVIESYLTDEQKKFSERLTESWILEQSKNLDLKSLAENSQSDLATFLAFFDSERTREIDSAFATLVSFANFVNFDFYFLLKKFDSGLPERNFSYKPKFEAINAEYVADDLADFLEVFLPLDLEADWPRVFAALKEYRKAEIIQIDTWNRILNPAGEVRRSQVLEQFVRYMKKDPYWSAQPRFPTERIVEPFLQKMRAQVDTLLHKIGAEKRNAKIDEVANQIFGTSVVVRMKNYTEKANVVFAKKMLGGYTQVQSLNYLKAYLMDHFKKDIREIVDILLIRGKWSTTVQSQQLSDSYHALLEVSSDLLSFDESIGDDTDFGNRIRTALAKSDRDKEQLKYLRTMLKDANDKAIALVTKSAVNLIQLGRQLKFLIEDQAKSGRHVVILNWKEIEGASSGDLKTQLIDSYKKIYYMMQLLQNFVKKEDTMEK
ncbi:MAG TPA: DUF5312 family protein [Rectinemataceae bacterium]|nr:DUF5312 family protein [Rectinemataceae bacterium]